MKTFNFSVLGGSAKWHRNVLKNLGSSFNFLSEVTSSLIGTGLEWTQKTLLAETPLIVGNEGDVTWSDRPRIDASALCKYSVPF